MDDITIEVSEFVNNISVTAQPNDQTIDITVTETVETVLLDVSTTVDEVTVTATQNVIVENITVDYVNNENNIDINVTDATQDVTLNITPTLVEINILRSGGEVNILQFDSLADFPATGSSDYFYLAKDTNKLYRWTGSAYAEISATANAVWGQIIGTLSEQTDLQNALNLKAPINSPTFTGTVSGITKAMVGLGQVDNTSDLDKPISTATQTALNAKQPLDADLTSIAALSGTYGFLKKTNENSYSIDTNTYLTEITSSDVTDALGFTPENAANKGVNNGYASLDGGGKVPSSQLPSYVDDVIEVANYASLPSTGETGKIYITLDTNKIYRWTGSVYVEVSSSAAVWGGITGTLSNQTDLQSALDAKQDDLNGTGFVKASGTTISYDNTTYYPASNPSGYTANTGTVTSVAMTVPSAFSVSGSPITSSGTLAISGAGTTAQYIRGDGTLATMPDISGFVPYTGATGNVDLGTHTIIAAKGTFSSSGSGDTVGITHSSGSGIALNITKGGNGEGIYVNKTSGSGNAVTIIGTLNATTLVKSGGTSTQFLKADGSVDSSTYLTSASLSGYVDTTGDQSIAGQKTFTGFAYFDNTIFLKQTTSISYISGYNSIAASSSGIRMGITSGISALFDLTSLTTNRDYILPNASGTLALTSDLHNAVTIGTANGLSLSTQVLSLALASSSTTGALSSTDWNTFNGKQNALTNPVTGTGTASYLPKFTGTSAIGNSLLYDTGSALLIGATSASDGQSKLELVSASTVGLKIISSGANGNNTFLSIQSSKEWRFVTNRGDLISGNQGDLIIRNNTDGINHIILNQGGSTTFANSVGIDSGDFRLRPNGDVTNSPALVLKSPTSGVLSLCAEVIGDANVNSNSLSLRVSNPDRGRFDALTIASTGAATFSSSVTAGSGTSSGYATLNLIDSGSGSARYASIRKNYDSPFDLRIRASNSESAAPIVFDLSNAAEAMRITSSGNVGIGTTAPSSKLTVAGSATNGVPFVNFETTSANGTFNWVSTAFASNLASGNNLIHFIGQSGSVKNSAYLGFKYSSSGSNDNILTLGLYGVDNVLNINGSGNVGIGTTAPNTTLDVNGTINVRTNGFEFGRITTNNVTGNIGGLTFQYNSSGTFTPGMVLTGGGNVGIGTTSPATLLDVRSSSAATIRVGSVTHGGGGDEFGNLEFFWADPDAAGVKAKIYAKNTGNVGPGGGGAADLLFATETPFGSLTERMRITSGGAFKASTSGTYLGINSPYHELRQTTSDTNIAIFTHTSSSPYGNNIYYPNASPNTTSNEFIYCNDSTQSKFIVWSNGSVVNRTGVYGTISDVRFKENIVDASPKLGDLDKLKVRNFNLKGESTKQIGFIAQEFEEVFPNMVDISIERGEDGETYKSIKTSVLIPMLVKAVQELKAELDTLKNK